MSWERIKIKRFGGKKQKSGNKNEDRRELGIIRSFWGKDIREIDSLIKTMGKIGALKEYEQTTKGDVFVKV